MFLEKLNRLVKSAKDIALRYPLKRFRPAALAAPLLPLFIAGCSVSLDESSLRGHQDDTCTTCGGSAASVSFNAEESSGAEPMGRDAEATTARAAMAYESCPEESTSLMSSLSPGSFFNIRYDTSEEEARAARLACANPDPCLQPTIAEQRKAKADAEAAAALKAQAGDTQIKPDGSSSNPSEIKFVAAPGALSMRIVADKNLNTIDGVPHALFLIVYQLSDRTALDQLTDDADGIRKLLEGAFFDASVKSVRQIYMQPSSESVIATDRSEDGRYVALVAGYNEPNTNSSVYVTSYGVGSYSKKNGALRKSTSMFCPLPLNLEVRLGETGLSVSETGEIHDNVRAARPM